MAGKSENVRAWLWVAAMPRPSQGATSSMPGVVPHSTPRTSKKNQSAPSSPSGTAVVTMNEVTPDPLPKCF